MPTASKPSAVAARKIANAIAEVGPACFHPDFFLEVNAYLNKLGLHIQAHQQGIAGTHIQIVKVQS